MISRKRLYQIFVLYFISVLSIAVLPPFVKLWNRIDPHILGLPFSQAMIILLSLKLSLGLLLWFVLEGKVNEAEKAKRESADRHD